MPWQDTWSESCILKLHEREIYPRAEAPYRYMREWTGDIVIENLGLDDRERAGERDFAGTFSVMVLDLESAVNERESVFEVFDAHQSTIGYFEALYEEDASFKPGVVKVAFGGDERWSPNLLILDRLMILERHRGSGLGLEVLASLIAYFRTGTGLIAMKPFPLQFEHDAGTRPNFEEFALGRFTKSERSSTAALRRYYRKLGFQLVPGTEYMVLSSDADLPDFR
jgi:GNAT superfamily N-acetyltransferase